MKHIITGVCMYVLLVMTLGCRSIKHNSENGSAALVTILSYNVRNCVGLDNVADYERVAKAITKINPDIAAIQELDSNTVRSKNISVLDKLADATGRIATFHGSIDYQGGKYGIGILSKEKPLSIKAVALPGTEEKRSAVAVEMRDYVLICTHLSLTQKDRLRSVVLIDSLASKYTKPVFLGGDLNSEPASPVISAFSKNWHILNDSTKPTIPSNKPDVCIDYIMVQKKDQYQVKLLDKVVGKEPLASDHLPVWVKLSISRK